ncbi:toll/interleukin-1 receptor domain-containing protein [Rhizobium sp. CSW-27]|uniref:toll/interleukin-1 receptor domain-containing protein n=1 Tax=Rhizobium sp. CSW-27 TaxID=2839985 RepID=UPI001C0268E7|nr:toll/interleukin-1 receptor domain-containing protein [Rhizobium sp. CSW-27]MBT9372547.1 toll/interleukin-1 receptor domain-containing protein [Rhizobium sp. CSW-27]
MMADAMPDIAAIRDSTSLEAYLRTRSIDEARVLALRSAVRVMPLLTKNSSFHLDDSKHWILADFRAVFFSWAAYNYTDYVRKLAPAASAAYAAAASAAVAAGEADVRAVVGAASYAARTAGIVDAETISFATVATARAARVGTHDAWEGIRRELTSMQEISATVCLAAPLWPQGRAPSELIDTEVVFRAALEAFNPDWHLVYTFYQALRDGHPPFAGLGSDLGAIALAMADEREDFWRREPDEVMRDLAERLGGGETPRKPEAMSDAASEKVDFFISYSTKNEAEAREINGYLEDAGYSTIVQFKDFPVGSNFVIEMQDGLERGARAIALLSPDYVASDHCRAEWAAVYNMDPLGKGRKLVPLLLKPANLNTLARQIVYKSLVGLNGEERRAAVLEAIGPGPDALAPDMLKRRLAETASPDVAPTPDGKLDVVPNAIYDLPVVDADLPDLPQMLRTLCTVIQASLPENSPKTIAPSLQAYGDHLAERGARPILGLLCMLADALNRDVRSVEFHVWGDGLATHFDNFFSCHSKYVTHFPKSQEREETLASNEIDEDRASGKEFLEPVKKVAEALAELHQIGGTTAEFERVVQDSVQRAKDIDSLPIPPDAGQGTDITPKRRFVFSQIGFWERILSALGSMTTLATTEQGRAAIATLAEAIRKFLSFLSSS